MGPRIFGIPATQSPIVAIIRRGPSGWCHVGCWDPEAAEGERWQPGSWIHATIYPQRCDVSPDGRWLVAFMLKGSARWRLGATYVSVSRLPWLTSLAAWGTDGTWTRGLAFVDRGTARNPPPPPEDGDVAPLVRRFDLDHRRPAIFAVERARGWTETPDSPPASSTDPWELQRAARVTMQKPRPGDAGLRLLVRGWHAAYREGEPRRGPAEYWLERDGEASLHVLPGVQWADWARDGRLLVATTAGELQVRPDPEDDAPSWRLDLAALRPETGEPPPEAREW